MIDVVLTPTEIRSLPERDLSRSVCVVLDVLRATSSMVTALSQGASRIVPADSVDHARHMAKGLPGSLLAGERNRVKLPGFDLANSPREFLAPLVAGKTIVMATTNGTRAIHACRKARAAYISSFLNVSSTAAVTARLLREGNCDLRIVCAGTEVHFSWEDCLAAGCLVERIRKHVPRAPLSDSAMVVLDAYAMNRRRLVKALRSGNNGRTLVDLGLEKDIAWAAKIDAFPLTARLRRRDGLSAVLRDDPPSTNGARRGLAARLRLPSRLRFSSR